MFDVQLTVGQINLEMLVALWYLLFTIKNCVKVKLKHLSLYPLVLGNISVVKKTLQFVFSFVLYYCSF